METRYPGEELLAHLKVSEKRGMTFSPSVAKPFLL